MDTPAHDYYEFLQISPNADAETIHRVYRFLAARLHPDNNETGHEENFRLLKAAYDVLSDPHRRKEYDAARAVSQTPPEPLAATALTRGRLPVNMPSHPQPHRQGRPHKVPK